ncbi:hypothetical protein Phum_PHUM366860 [Pediculus humanus corporis]|uniref:Uncharacterized protein n=1 Tax=Pediculus humanus subsp. corporis TaxID=121224 RepID=E0VPX0_PEDHC|nr:uncharacterized protein Phum_PHUM366860 [Pediculus humanus corporis]EEB15426.1 hypothetical protein Phum_PHUM366860 [Pediculus humanus corporis]
MLLGFWEKTFILAGAGFLIILTIIVVSCFVGPGCLGFEYLRKKKRKIIKNQILGIVPDVSNDDKTSSSHVCLQSNWNTWINDNRDYVIYQTGKKITI